MLIITVRAGFPRPFNPTWITLTLLRTQTAGPSMFPPQQNVNPPKSMWTARSYCLWLHPRIHCCAHCFLFTGILGSSKSQKCICSRFIPDGLPSQTPGMLVKIRLKQQTAPMTPEGRKLMYNCLQTKKRQIAFIANPLCNRLIRDIKPR